MNLRHFFILLFTLCSLGLTAQKKSATIQGSIVDDNNTALRGVSITILGKTTGTLSNDSGNFRLRVPAEQAFALVFSFSGYRTEQRNFFLTDKEEERIQVRMERSGKTMEEVVVKSDRTRKEPGLITLDPTVIPSLPSTVGGVEGLIKMYVGSNNELTSQYSVRGGNYDENLIYINDFEIFRPYLVRSGQQEGLSFINPELTQNILFYNGSFPARYGDKMSSALDIRYKKPKNFGGSAYIGLLEQGLHLEGSNKKEKFRYLFGVRNRSNRNLLSEQEIKGSYLPSSYDGQLSLQYILSEKWQIEFLGIASRTKFDFIPEESQLTTSIFSPLFTANVGLDIYFTGQEKDSYKSYFTGLSIVQQLKPRLQLKWMAGRLNNQEQERYDIEGAYLFGERDFDKSNPTYGSIVNPLGAGIYHSYARNQLDIEQWSATHKGSWEAGKHSMLWGTSFEWTSIQDRLLEWESSDSAGYVLPNYTDDLILQRAVNSAANLDVFRWTGYLQDNITLTSNRNFTIQPGIRFNYNNLNGEFLLSPRLQASWLLGSKQDWVIKGGVGSYNQPPFYRELRRYDGTLNESLLAQKSWQISLGADHQFQIKNRPFRFSTEAYYKKMWDVVPYDIDNVRIRYYGENMAKAYATGIDLRLSGEWVKDAESWVSLGFMKTMEDLEGDHYYDYYNENGELITSQTPDQVVTDSTRREVGWVRRPTDRLITFGLYLQDYLSTNKNFKAHVGIIYGSNMPYNLPDNPKYRNGLIIEPYIRVDIGFSVLLLDTEKKQLRSHSPFHGFRSIWASLEIFNLIDRANTISYQLIKDYSNTTFAVPNRLTPRMLNLKLMTRF